MAKKTIPASQTAPTATPATTNKKGGRRAAPENETKAERFVRLAQQRATKALKAIQQIANLGGAAYESTPEQREKLIGALSAAVKTATDKLNKTPEQKAKGGFTF